MVRPLGQPRLEISLVSSPQLAPTQKAFSYWDQSGRSIVTQNFHRAQIRIRNCGDGEILFFHRWIYSLEIASADSTAWQTVDPPALFSSLQPIPPGDSQTFTVLIPDIAAKFRLKCAFRRSQPASDFLNRVSSLLNIPFYVGDLNGYEAQSDTWAINGERTSD